MQRKSNQRVTQNRWTQLGNKPMTGQGQRQVYNWKKLNLHEHMASVAIVTVISKAKLWLNNIRYEYLKWICGVFLMSVCKVRFTLYIESIGVSWESRAKESVTVFCLLFSSSRLTPNHLNESQISSGNISAVFSLPSSVSRLVPSDKPVNLRVSFLWFTTLLLFYSCLVVI